MKICECGCGLPTKMITHTDNKNGRKKGRYSKFLHGHNTKGKHNSIETRKKISVANKGKIISEETRLKMSKSMTDKHPTQETRKKMSEAHTGNKNHFYGKHHTKITKEKLRQASLGVKFSKEVKEKLSKIAKNKGFGKWMKYKLGENSHNWKGGITPLYKRIRNLDESKQWRSNVYQRDNWTCQTCETRGCKLESHHIKPFTELLQEFLQEYNQFSPLKDQHDLLRLATKYEPFWDTNNGITLCEKCHNLTKKRSVL